MCLSITFKLVVTYEAGVVHRSLRSGGYEVGVRSLAGAPVRKLREVRGMEDLQICTGDERA